MASFTVSPSSIQHTKGGETTNVQFSGSVPQDLAYTITGALNNWIYVTLDGNNTTITSDQNSGTGRTATVTFYDPSDTENAVDVVVEQEAGTHPSFSVTPGRYYVGKKGGSISISFSGDLPDNITHTIYYNIVNNSKVVSSGDLANPQNELDWFSLQNNIITIQEWSNTSGTYYNREGYIRFQDSLDPENYVDLWIHQCFNFQLEPVQIYAPISGGSYYVNMMLTSASSNYSYSALPQWITISPVTNPITAREEMLVTVSANSSTKRTGSITITDADGEDVTFKVSQTGSDTSSYPSFSFVPSSYTFKCCASRYTFIREGLGYANNGGYIPYNINVSCPSWMNVVYSDHMEVIVDVEDNTGSQRTGSLILTDADNSSNVYTITVTQEAAGSRVMTISPYSGSWHIIDPVYSYYTVATYNTTVSISKSANWINCSEISTSTPDSTYTLGPNKKIYQINPSLNSGSTSRTGYVYFTDSDNNRSDYEVYQAGPFTANPSSISFPYTSSSTNVVLSNGENSSGVRVNSSDFPGWLHSTEYSYGTNSYTISADKNKYHKTRNFDVDFYDGTVNSYYRKTTVPVTQASNTQAFTVSPSSIDFTVDASTVTVVANHYDNSVSANYSELPDWLNCTIASSTNELVSFNVSALSNRSQTDRSFTINFTDFLDGEAYSVKSVLVNQSGRDTPVLRCTPSSMSFVSGGGSDTVGVNYYGSLSYDSLPSWLSLIETSSVTGVKNYYTVTAASNSGEARSHSITFTDSEGSVAFPVSQDAGYAQISVSPSSLTYNYLGGGQLFTVSNIPAAGFEVVNNSGGQIPDWVTITGSTSSRAVSVSINNTPGPEGRSVDLKVQEVGNSSNYALVNVGQSGSFYCSPSSIDFTSSESSSLLYARNFVGSYVTYSVTSVPSWLSVDLSVETSVFKKYIVTAASNTTDVTRSYDLVFRDENTYGSIISSFTVPVTQASGSEPSPISVSPSTLSFTDTGGSQTVTVTSSDTVTYSGVPDWITITNSGGVYTVTAAANTGAARTSTITFTDSTGSATVVVSQEASSTHISISPSSLNFNRDGGSQTVTVTSSGTVSYSGVPSWITITNSGYVYTITAAANTGSARTKTITFTDDSGSVTLYVSQVSEAVGDSFTPIWKDVFYYASPSDFPDDLSYKIIVYNSFSNTPSVFEGYIPFLDAATRSINITRLVEDSFPNISNIYNMLRWSTYDAATITVYIYQKGDPDVLLNTYHFIEDWSYYIQGYYQTKTLCDPINGHGCDNMTIPLFAFSKGDTSFSLVETSTGGSQTTTALGTPNTPVMGGFSSYYGDKKVELKSGDNTIVTYDLTYCGSGSLIYRNRFGGYDSFLIEGNIEKKDDFTRDKYNFDGFNSGSRNIGMGGYNTYDVHIKTSYTAHTGWLTDDQAERLVFHLLSSPDVYFQSFEGFIYGERHANYNMTKVMITDSSAVYKKFKNGRKMVSYDITFEICDTKKIVY